jgi:hypothetical protein
MPGGLAFAWESPTWGGGIAFYEPEVEGSVLARAYLITARQFSDVLEQEMRREPGADVDLTQVMRDRRHTLGPGRYETLHLAGELDGRPVVTFSAPDIEQLGVAPPPTRTSPPWPADCARPTRSPTSRSSTTSRAAVASAAPAPTSPPSSDLPTRHSLDDSGGVSPRR